LASELLKVGLQWRIGGGNGALVKISKDKILSTPISFAIQTPRNILDEDEKND
jgi:hypothetical protein